MSERNVELHRRANQAFNARDVEAFLAFCDPEIELESSVTGSHHGHEGVRKWHRDLTDAFGGGLRVEPQAYFEAGDGTVSFHRLYGRGQHSGAAVATPAAHLCRWRDGLIVYFRGYRGLNLRREDVLRDLGLPEDAAPAVSAAVRLAGEHDAPAVAGLLHDFNTEFSEPTPGTGVLAERVETLIAGGEITVLLGGEGPDGLAVLRFRPSYWTGAPDAYLEELYVAPPHRGRGMGRALLEAALETARAQGATHIDLGTSEADTAALALYESTGFTNREGSPDGPRMLYFEREL